MHIFMLPPLRRDCLSYVEIAGQARNDKVRAHNNKVRAFDNKQRHAELDSASPSYVEIAGQARNDKVRAHNNKVLASNDY